MMFNGWGNMMGGFGVLAMIVGLLISVGILVLIGYGIAWLARQSAPPHAPPLERKDDPLDIARRRLAQGEITPEQFEEIRKRLQ